MHPLFKQIFDEYSELYSKQKAMRKIQFHYNLGHVNLTLSFKNGDFDFKCMPVHAILISNLD
jgi:anaphase-promoting complex subunit 2